MNRYVAESQDEGRRIDAVIAKASAQPRSVVAAAHRAGHIRINGIVAKPSTLVHFGDLVEFALEPRGELTVEPQDLPLDIIHEDDDVLVVFKPAGMVTHPAHGAVDGTLVNGLLAHLPTLPGERARAGLVHRLDRDTSGLLLVAKTAEALGTLGRAMQARYIGREYLALVNGIPEHLEGTIDGPIGRDPLNRMRNAIRTDGRPAVTHFKIREKLASSAELVLKLETGRTHQVRVHLAALGHAVVNDPVYGRSDERFALPGQALHAWRLKFKHPETKEYLEFEVDPPAEYAAAKELLRR